MNRRHSAPPKKVAALVSMVLMSFWAEGPTGAQVVFGTVKDSSNARGLPSATVTLLHHDTDVVARGAMTSEQGGFSMTVPPGRYTLEVKRIGFRRQRSQAFELQSNQRRQFDVILGVLPAALAPVRVVSHARCGREMLTDRETAVLWDEASAVLLATHMRESERRFKARIQRFRRTRSARSGYISDEERSEHHGYASAFFRSVSPALLDRVGYVVSDGRSARTYYAPDAATLLSPEFVASHCFQAVPGDRANKDMVGLSFKPAPDRKLPDIKGVLWLDPRSRELRRLEYSYVGHPHGLDDSRVGGEVEFARVSHFGGWVVRRWAIRMPEYSIALDRQSTGGVRERAVVSAIVEEGGEVVSEDEQIAVHPAAGYRVRGFVHDSSARGPLSRADVRLVGRPESSVTDDLGRFEIAVADSGAFTLQVHHARLDTLGRLPLETAVVASEPPRAAPYVLAVPSAASVARALCRSADGRATSARAVRLHVLAPDGTPLGHDDVHYEWRLIRSAVGRPEAPVRGVARLDAEGWATLCGQPYARRVRIDVGTRDGRRGSTTTLVPDAGVVVVVVPLARTGVR